MPSRKPTPSFVLRLTGGDVLPEKVPIRTLSDAASAVTRLAIGHQNEDSDDHSVRIIGVKRGSAVYSCLMESTSDPTENLRSLGTVLANPDSDLLTHHMLGPIEQLARTANKLKCQIEILAPKDRTVFATIRSDSYTRIRGKTVLSDQASISGYLVRVGGASERKCAMRIFGRDRLLICHVATEQLSRELGRHLYERVNVEGRGLFFSRTWDLLRLRIDRASFTSERSYDELMEEFRRKGGDAWDDVADVEEELRSIR